jgi:hypothetical protein
MGLPKPMGQAGWAGQLPKACRAQAQGPLLAAYRTLTSSDSVHNGTP